MKNKFLSVCLIGLGLGSINAQYVGINTDTPAAALDIKSATDDGAKVMRFSTTPSKLDQKKEFVLFAGEKVGDGYNLRRVSLDELFSVVGVYIPSTKRIVATNNTAETFAFNTLKYVKLDNEAYNSSNTDYTLDKNNGEIEIKKAGHYDITSWIGFKALPSFSEGDVVLTLYKKGVNDTGFSAVKSAVVSRSNTWATIQVGSGVGASFAFVDKFEAGDKIKLAAKNLLYQYTNEYSKGGVFKENPSVETVVGSVSLTVTRVDSELLNAVTPTTP